MRGIINPGETLSFFIMREIRYGLFALLALATCFLGIYHVRFVYDNYDIHFHNRISKLGFAVKFDKGIEVWHFAHTIHGGKVEKILWKS